MCVAFILLDGDTARRRRLWVSGSEIKKKKRGIRAYNNGPTNLNVYNACIYRQVTLFQVVYIYLHYTRRTDVCVCVYDYNVDGEEMFGGGVKGFCGNYKNPFSQYIGHSREQCTEYGRTTPPILLV